MRTFQWMAGAVSAILIGAAPVAASATTLVKVELWDKGAGMAMPSDQIYGTPGVDSSKASMGVKLSRASAPAGVVMFVVTNSSKVMQHEMIVMALADAAKPLPYIDADARVDEDKAGDKGEVSELETGKTGTLSVTLAPGKYLLICNVPNHFAAGMWTTFTVTK